MKTKHIIQWLWQHTSTHRVTMLLITFTGIIRVLFGLGFVYASKYIIDIATGNIVGSLLTIAIIMAGIILCEILLDAGNTWFIKIMEIKLQNKIRHSTFKHLLKTKWSNIEAYHSGDLVNRIEQDVKDIVTLLSSSVPLLIVSGIQFLASFIFLLLLDSTLAWIVVGIMPIFLLASKLYMKKMRRLTLDIRTTDSQVQSLIQESVQHHVIIKTMERVETLLYRLNGIQSALHKQVYKKTRFSVFSRSMVMLGFAGGYLFAFLWGVFRLNNGSISFGVMAAFLQLVGQIQRPTIELSRLVPSFISGLTASERLMELEQLPLEKDTKPQSITNLRGLRINNVDFAYKNGHNIFNNFSFDFPIGENIAIIGETGAGKTSLIRLLLALVEPQKGDIYLYDDKGQKFPVSANTRGCFIYVPQGNTLLSGTIRENLLLGNPNATDEEIKNVLETSVAEFVYSLPDGLDAKCGESGSGLSEGQAQRIAIARALLRPGKILLLDEATSALDIETEKELLSRIHKTCTDKTVIFVTHRTAIADTCKKKIIIN